MPDYGKILSQDPFGMPQDEKGVWYFGILQELTRFHYDHCAQYKNIVDRITGPLNQIGTISDLPFVPVRLFKSLDLKSIDEGAVIRTLTSSGTSGGKVSRIHLNKKAILLQSRVLSHIYSSIFPKDRDVTMFLVEKAGALGANAPVSASVAAVRGFSQFAKTTIPLLDDEGLLDLNILTQYLNAYPGKPFVIFGFTGPVWFNLIAQLRSQNIKFPPNNGILVHGGGWKKMQDSAVDKSVFNATARSALGVTSVHNYYGMVEQTGSVFIECDQGYFHSSIFSEVIIRNDQLKPASIGEAGIIQVMSLLAESYPGHNLLTDDIGVIHGEDHCGCGRRGKFFSVLGRVPGVELRGCSDAN